MELEEIRNEIQNSLSKQRYLHSIGTMKCAKELAKQYHVDEEKAMLVGLTHDIAKELARETSLNYVQENKLSIDWIELENTSLLHGKIGADMVKKKYHFSEEMQKAICYHTTGSPNMDLLAKILFVADKIEETRKEEVKQLDQKRKIAFLDIDEAMILLLDQSIQYTIEKGKLIHPSSIETRNRFVNEKQKNSKKETD